MDEWTLMQKLGDNARSVMTEHYETWITEDDIEKIYQAGMNHIRIPVGESGVRVTCLRTGVIQRHNIAYSHT